MKGRTGELEKKEEKERKKERKKEIKGEERRKRKKERELVAGVASGSWLLGHARQFTVSFFFFF